MRQPTFIRAVDSWVVGVAGGSLALLGRRGIAAVGPRSAHIAGLPYASFASAEELHTRSSRSSLPGRRPRGIRLHRRGGRPVRPDGDMRLDRSRARACRLVPRELPRGRTRCFEPLARKLGGTPEDAARALLDTATGAVAAVISEAANSTGFRWTSRWSRSAVQARRSSPKRHADSTARPCSRAMPRSFGGRRGCLAGQGGGRADDHRRSHLLGSLIRPSVSASMPVPHRVR